MLIDNETLFCENLDIGLTQQTIYSSFALDMGSAEPDIGAGKPMFVICCFPEAVVGSSSTIKIEIVDEEDVTLDGSSVVLVSTRAIPEAILTKGKIIVIPLPIGLMTQRYLGLKITIGGNTTTAGTLTAYLAFEAPSNVPIT